jgi:hypothetical protein
MRLVHSSLVSQQLVPSQGTTFICYVFIVLKLFRTAVNVKMNAKSGVANMVCVHCNMFE